MACFTIGCGHGAVPRPVATPIVASDYVEVPYTPRPPPVEIVPDPPKAAGDLVWADGGWEWSGERYRWEAGAWVAVPPGAKRAKWAIVRREIDGQLFFAPSSWRDANGNAMKAPRALARALQRPGGGASSVEGGGADAPTNTAPPARSRSGGVDE